MKRCSPQSVSVVLALVASGCCQEDEQDVRLSGEVSYPAYASGQIVVIATESDSSRCNGSSINTQHPGVAIAKVVLDRPGDFSLTGTVRYVGSAPPEVVLQAFLTQDTAAYWRCDAGAVTTLPAGDASNVRLELVAGSCPMLK